MSSEAVNKNTHPGETPETQNTKMKSHDSSWEVGVGYIHLHFLIATE